MSSVGQADWPILVKQQCCHQNKITFCKFKYQHQIVKINSSLILSCTVLYEKQAVFDFLEEIQHPKYMGCFKSNLCSINNFKNLKWKLMVCNGN